MKLKHINVERQVPLINGVAIAIIHFCIFITISSLINIFEILTKKKQNIRDIVQKATKYIQYLR